MADAKKSARKKKKKEGAEGDPIEKDETTIAKYLRWNLPAKKSTLYGDQVEYFIGSKAVDFLMESKWATGKASKSKIQFTDRESVTVFLDRLLLLGLFNHVQRVKKENKKTDKKQKEGSPKEVRKRKPEKLSTPPKDNKDETKDGKKKRKVKYTLVPHDEHVFVDDDEAFLWIFDPVHPRSLFMGVLLVLGVIACCLFPLWPDSVRVYSWYISMAIAGSIGSLFAIGFLRYVVFAILWAASFGKLRFWFLPNLTAECGFFESFKPKYEYSYRGRKVRPAVERNDSTTEDCGQEEAPTQATTEAADLTGEDNSSGKEGRDTDAENENESSWVKVKKTDAEKTSAEDC